MGLDDETKMFFKSLLQEHQTKYDEGQGQINASLEIVTQKLNRLEGQVIPEVKDLQKKTATLEKKVTVLERENEILHKMIRRNNLLFSGIPEDLNCETSADLPKKINDILKNYAVTPAPANIDVAFRVGKYQIGKSRPIKVRFIYQSQADEILSKSHEKDGPLRRARIYVNEDVSAIEGTNRYLIRKETTAAKRAGALVENWKTSTVTIQGIKLEAKGGILYRDGKPDETQPSTGDRNF